MPRLSPKERKYVLFIAAVGLILRLALIFRSEALIYSRPYFDDTFYATACSYNLAHGLGLTCDGVHPTNGIQPLMVFVEVPIFALAGADKLLGLRLTLALEAVIDAISILLCATLIARLRKKDPGTHVWRSSPVIGAISWAFLFNMIRQTMNGLETGLFSMLILAVLLFYQKLRAAEQPRIGAWAGLGALLGLLVLARIDCAFVACGVVVAELARIRMRALRPLLVMGIMSILVSAPWWIFNYTQFGSIMPMSGQSEALGIDLYANIFDGAVAIADILSALFFFPFQELPAWSRWAWSFLVPIFVLGIVFRFHLYAKVKEEYNLGGIAPLAIASVGFVVFYIFFFAAWWFLNRYFQPLRILWTILLSIGLSAILQQVAGHAESFRRKAYQFGLGLIFLVAAAWNVDRYAINFMNTNIYSGYLVGKWALAHPSSTIGMEQAGTPRFIASNIVNLDGKVNPEALAARRHGAIGKYVLDSRFDYIIDWPFIAGPIAEQATKAGAKYIADGKIGVMDVFRRVAP